MTSKSTPRQRPPKSCVTKLLKIRTKLAAVGKLDARQSREYAAKIYRIVLRLSSDIDEWQKFCEHPDWAGEKRKPQPKNRTGETPLRFSIKFAVGFGLNGLNASGSRVRAFHDLLRGAWSEQLASAKIEEHVKGIQEDKRTKAAEAKSRSRENSPRTVTLMPNRFSKPLLAQKGKYLVKGTFEILIQETGKPVLTIVRLGKKTLTSLGIVKAEKPKPTK